MAKVYFNERLREFTGDVGEVDVEAATYRELVRVLAARFPGIETVIADDSAVAIDGVIINEPFLEPIAADSEVHFLARLGGG